jgi:glycosyltransferase involved in cell wall biosynthesis
VTPKISVIIPAWNAGRFLEEAVASILHQGHPDLEIVLVDDGSTDHTSSVVSRLGPAVRSFKNESPLGPAAARNRALREARGEIIAFLDADDLWAPGKLTAQLPFLDKSEEAIVFSYCQRFRMEKDLRIFLSGPVFMIQLGSIMLRRKAVDKIGFFTESMRFGEDSDWFFRIRQMDTVSFCLPQATLYYRQHEDNMTNTVTGADSTYLPALKQAIARRRENPALSLRPEPWGDLIKIELKNKS